jgi:hypothetical protein
MNYSPLYRITISTLIILIALSACDGTDTSADETAAAAIALTVEAEATKRAATLAAGQPDEPDEPSEPQPPPIVHVVYPEAPTGYVSCLTDRSSADFAEEHRTIGDSYNINLYERPFTRGEMDYLPHLDIVYVGLNATNIWLYATIFLEEAPPEGVRATYGIELDLDLDGRGDWLIMGLYPPSSKWTTDGVRAFRDANEDVGSETPLRNDEPDPELDGYEDMVFNNGLGPDPDAAWIRQTPDYPEEVQLAIKLDLFQSDTDFLWGAWADQGVKKPEWLDYNDKIPHSLAGDPAIISEHYPINELFAMDNTCRWAFGYTPTGAELGLCEMPPEELPEPGEGPNYIGCCRPVIGAPGCASICECFVSVCPLKGYILCSPCVLPSD